MSAAESQGAVDALLAQAREVDQSEARVLECMRSMMVSFTALPMLAEIDEREAKLRGALESFHGSEDECTAAALRADIDRLNSMREAAAQYAQLADGARERQVHVDALVRRATRIDEALADVTVSESMEVCEPMPASPQGDTSEGDQYVREIEADMERSREILAACEARAHAAREAEVAESELWARQSAFAADEYEGVLSSLSSLCMHGAGMDGSWLARCACAHF